MTNESIVNAQLQAAEMGLKVEIIYHERSGKSTDQAVEALGMPASMIIKSLILYSSKERMFFGFIILGTDQLDIKKACQVAGVKKMSFASSVQIEHLTGFNIGGVPPTSLQTCSAVFVDNRVVQRGFVIGAGGDERCGMKFSPKHLVEKMKTVVADVTK